MPLRPLARQVLFADRRLEVHAVDVRERYGHARVVGHVLHDHPEATRTSAVDLDGSRGDGSICGKYI